MILLATNRIADLECVGGPLDGTMVLASAEQRTFTLISSGQVHTYGRADDDTGARYWRWCGVSV